MAEEISVDVVRKNVKRISIRVKRDRSVLVTVPLFTPDAVWEKFFKEQRGWIEKKLAEMPERGERRFVQGEEHWLLGRRVTLDVLRARENSCRVIDDRVRITYNNPRNRRDRLYAECCARELSAVIEDLLAEWAPKMGVRPAGFTIKLTKSRWGSCNVKTGEITFSLELAAKPVACIESVVVHELCHLLEASHSPRFHELMTKFLPDWKERQKKLNSFPREFY